MPWRFDHKYKSYSKNETFSDGSPQEILNNLYQNHNGVKFKVSFLFYLGLSGIVVGHPFDTVKVRSLIVT